MKAGGNWPTVQKIIELFTAVGCELSTHHPQVFGENGPYSVRYLYNPETDGMACIGQYEDADRVPLSDILNWERRLGAEIPKLDEWGQ